MIHWNFELTIRILNSTACNRAMDFRSVFVIVQSIQRNISKDENENCSSITMENHKLFVAYRIEI